MEMDRDPSVVGTPCSDADTSVLYETPPKARRDDPLFVPDTPDMRKVGETRIGTASFLTCGRQLDRLISDINRTSSCKAEGCNGELILKNLELEGMGGDGQAYFYCSGRCGTRDLCLPCSGTHKESKQSIALQVAFICSGASYAQYEAVLGSMGMNPVPDYRFYDTIMLLEDHTERLLDGQCEVAKQEMKNAPPDEIGSWQRAVTVADGAWMTRGHHSQNFTFHVRDYMRNSVLYYIHFCQRGKKPLYAGTSKSMEGAAAEIIFPKMKEEGMVVKCHWQDADSTSGNVVNKVWGREVTKLCGGHYTRAHLKKIKQQKHFSPADQNKYKNEFPEVLHATCSCKTIHKAGCGCFTDLFIAASRHKLH